MWRSPALTDRIAAPGVGLLLLAVYWASAPRTVVLEDDGYFLQAAWFNAIAHPPGYPLYTALAHLATLVPVGSVALRVHGLTGVMAAGAAVLLYLFGRRLGLSVAAALVSSLVLGLSQAYWSQAIIAEVYALNVLLFLACALVACQMGREPSAVKAPAALLAGLLYGLGLSNHWPLLVLASPALVALAWPARHAVVRAGHYVAMGMVVGLLPYAWLVWRTHVVPEYCFAGPINSWEAFRFYVGREAYAGQDHSATAGWADRAGFAWFVLAECWRQFGLPGILLLCAGLAGQRRLLAAHVRHALVLGWLSATFLLIALLGFDYDALHRFTFRPYPLIPWAMSALWIGIGLQWLGQWLAGQTRHGRAVVAAMVVLVLAASFSGSLPQNWRRGDDWAEAYARAVLDALPANARFYGNADTVNGPVGYVHRVLGVRPDVTFVSGYSLPWRGHLYRPYAMAPAELEQLLDEYVAADEGPVFYSNGFPASMGQDDYGLFFGVNPGAGPGTYRVMTAAPAAAWFQTLDHQPEPRDPWESMHLRLLRQDQCRWEVAQAGGVLPATPEGLPPACLGLQGRVWLAGQIGTGSMSATAWVAALLPDDPRLLAGAVTKGERLRYLSLRAAAQGGPGPAGAEAPFHGAPAPPHL